MKGKNVRGVLSRKTMKIRYFLVKQIAPTLYKQAQQSNANLPRPMTLFVKANFGNSLVGVEIGVAWGENAKSILETLPMKKLYLIDPYTPYLQDGKLIMNYKDCFPIAKEKPSKFKDKVQFILKKSSEAVNNLPDNLDFVYIDGNHTYEFVKKDIDLYYPKIRKKE
jgi:hypothetical protein